MTDVGGTTKKTYVASDRLFIEMYGCERIGGYPKNRPKERIKSIRIKKLSMRLIEWKIMPPSGILNE